jgi:hypothetical protein
MAAAMAKAKTTETATVAEMATAMRTTCPGCAYR